MQINIMHNENMKTFKAIAYHLKLEKERLEVARTSYALVTETNLCRTFCPKQKKANKV